MTFHVPKLTVPKIYVPKLHVPKLTCTENDLPRRDSDDETETTAGADGHSCVTDCRSAVDDDAMETPSHSKTMAVNMLIN